MEYIGSILQPYFKIEDYATTYTYLTYVCAICTGACVGYFGTKVYEFYIPLIHVSYYTNSQKKEEYTVVNGIYHGIYKSWHENGHKKEECIWVQGFRDGICQDWHENGQIRSEVTFVNRQQHGIYSRWYENGQKYEECTYVNGKQHGLYQRWNKNGQKTNECTYVHGVKQKAPVFVEDPHAATISLTNEDLCAITYEPFVEKENIVICTRCKTHYHKDSLEMWFENANHTKNPLAPFFEELRENTSVPSCPLCQNLHFELRIVQLAT